MKRYFFSCSECIQKFGNNLGKFSTAIGFNLHLSIIHKVTTEIKTLKNRPKSESFLIDENKDLTKFNDSFWGNYPWILN